MKVFLSWSGVRSRMVAEALNDWLPRVIQAIEPFYSPQIEKGAQWGGEIGEALSGTKFGIVCLTPENLDSRWIHYEAGALSKTTGARIWTFLLALRPSDVGQPLGQFQATVAERDDVLKLTRAINSRLSDIGAAPLSARLLEENFAVYWPALQDQLERAGAVVCDDVGSVTPGEVRNERAILDEILNLIRSQERRLDLVEANQTRPVNAIVSARPTAGEQLGAHGASLESKHPLLCKECGAINEPLAWYCEICGTELDTDPTTGEANPAPR